VVHGYRFVGYAHNEQMYRDMQIQPDVHPEPERVGAASSSGGMDCAPVGDAESVDRIAPAEHVSSIPEEVHFLPLSTCLHLRLNVCTTLSRKTTVVDIRDGSGSL